MQKETERKKLQEYKRALAPFLESPRAFPWRETADPYAILVSEIMLQQTQTGRVVAKYEEFLKAFPTIAALASAPQKELLAVWSGLGYNRRALFLQRAAKEIMEKYKGKVPDSPELLEALPGIGHYTARAIAAFAFNTPYAFIETNIRTVFLHHFFGRARKPVSDMSLLALVEKVIDKKEPRRWYAALMDYGAHLKSENNTAHRKSASYARQSAFSGSVRQLRGIIIRIALSGKSVTVQGIRKETDRLPADIRAALEQLAREGFLKKRLNSYVIS